MSKKLQQCRVVGHIPIINPYQRSSDLLTFVLLLASDMDLEPLCVDP